MCMAIARNGRGFSYVITDTMITRWSGTPDEEHIDRGARLLPMATGFIALMGSGRNAELAGEAVAAAAPQSLDDAAAVVRELVVAGGAPGPWSAPEPSDGKPPASSLFLAGDGWAGTIWFNKAGEFEVLPADPDEFVYDVGIPEPEHDTVGRGISRGLDCARGSAAFELVNMARLFCRVADHTPRVSRTLHIGIRGRDGHSLFREVSADAMAAWPVDERGILRRLHRAPEPAVAPLQFIGNKPTKFHKRTADIEVEGDDVFDVTNNDLDDVPDGDNHRKLGNAMVGVGNRQSVQNSLTITAEDFMGGVRITVSAHTLKSGGTSISYNQGQTSGWAYSTTYFIYYDDPTFAGGTLTVNPVTSWETVVGASDGRYYVGKVTTPASGQPNETGDPGAAAPEP